MQPSKQRVKYADGSISGARGELTLPLRILTQGRGFECKLRVIVADLQPRFDLVLGTPFCKAHKPKPDWERMTIELPETKRNGSVVWRAALRSSAPSLDSVDSTAVGLCELSVDPMERL